MREKQPVQSQRGASAPPPARSALPLVLAGPMVPSGEKERSEMRRGFGSFLEVSSVFMAGKPSREIDIT